MEGDQLLIVNDKRFIWSRAHPGPNQFVQRLHALDIATGAPQPDRPVVVKASARGAGGGSSNGELVSIHRSKTNERRSCSLTGLSILPGHLTAIRGHSMDGSWAMTRLRSSRRSRNRHAKRRSGRIWQSSSGPSADRRGNLYLTVGNGSATARIGDQDYGSAFLKLSASGEVLDWFIPFNFEQLNGVRSGRSGRECCLFRKPIS